MEGRIRGRRMAGFVGLPGSRVLSTRRLKGDVHTRRRAQLGDVSRGTRVVMLSNVIERIKENTNLEKLVILTNSDLIEMSEEGNRLNALSLRAIADMSVSSVIYELGSSLYCCSCLFTQLQYVASEHVCQLAAGAALGVWTMSTTLGSMMAQKAAEEAKIQTEVGKCSKEIAAEWVDYINSVDCMLDLSPIVYESGPSELQDQEEVEIAMTWLFAMDEVEGNGARRLMEKLVEHPNADLRQQLAKTLGELCPPSNGVVSILQRLRQDSHSEVSNEAQSTLMMFVDHGVVASDVIQQGPKVELSLEEARSMLSRILAKSSSIESAVEAMRSGGIHAFRTGLGQVERGAQPLARIGQQELHLLCNCSLFLLMFNLGHVFHFYYTPVRFLGLGWVFAVGGLAVYPQSALAFSALQKTWENPFWARNA